MHHNVNIKLNIIIIMKVEKILAVEYQTTFAVEKNLKNPGLTGNRTLTFAMTRRNALSIKLT